MALTQRPERKSMSASYTDGSKGVLAMNAAYSTRNIAITIDFFDESYCTEHKDEIESAITAFLSTFKGVLSEANLPSI